MKKIFYKINNFFLNKLKISYNLSKKLGDEKLCILDVGASGYYYVNKFNYFFSNLKISKVIKFDEKNKIFHNESDENYDNFLWSEDTTKNFYVTANKVSSSLFIPNHNKLKDFLNFENHIVVEKKEVKLKKLDNFNFGSTVDFVKIDAEGSELEILKGGKIKLNDSLGFEVEQQYLERFISSPNFFEVSKYFYDLGYELFVINNNLEKK